MKHVLHLIRQRDQQRLVGDAPLLQQDPAERRYAEELAFLEHYDEAPRPPSWRLSPAAVVTFVMGSGPDPLRLPKGSKAPKAVVDKMIVELKAVL